MDTETFLVERDQLRVRLAEHRTAVSVLHDSGQNAKVLGMDLRDLTSLVLASLPARGLWRWMPKSLMAFAAPLAAGMLKKKFSQESPLKRISSLIFRSFGV